MLLCYPKPKNHWYYWFFAVTFAVTFFENVTFSAARQQFPIFAQCYFFRKMLHILCVDILAKIVYTKGVA